MTNHVDLPNSELHEPKGFKPLTGGAADIGKVAVSKGDGTSEVRKLKADEIEDLTQGLLSGVFRDDNMATGTVTVQVEGKKYYEIGAAPTQVIQVRLPDPAAYDGELVVLKRLDENAPDGSQVKFIPNAAETIDGMSEAGVTVKDNAIAVVSDGTNWAVVLSHLVNTGWELYADDQYLVGTERTILDGVTTQLTINGNGAFTNVTEASPTTQPAWDTTLNLITQYLVGQMTMYRVFFYATPSAVNVSVKVEFQIVGSFTIAGQTVRMPAGSGVRQQVLVTVPIFADALSLANNIQVNITPMGGDIDLDTATIMSVEMHMPRGI